MHSASKPCRAVTSVRLADAPIALECRLHQIIEFGERRQAAVVGEVLRFQVRDDLYRDGKIDFYALNPVARLGGPHYATLGEKLTFRPGGTTLPRRTTTARLEAKAAQTDVAWLTSPDIAVCG